MIVPTNELGVTSLVVQEKVMKDCGCFPSAKEKQTKVGSCLGLTAVGLQYLQWLTQKMNVDLVMKS